MHGWKYEDWTWADEREMRLAACPQALCHIVAGSFLSSHRMNRRDIADVMRGQTPSPEDRANSHAAPRALCAP